jgi:transglutaminase-like putative cysteine protease
MVRSEASAAISVERFFQFSLLGLVASGYLAVAGSGYLDSPTIALTTAGLLLRGLLICGAWRFDMSERATTLATVAYAGFFLADYFLISRDFLTATVHLVFFLAVIKILTSKTSRDYLYTAVIAFLELLAAAILSVNVSFFLFLALYLLFAIAALTSGEIRRSMNKSKVTARSGLKRFHPRLGLLSASVAFGILALTAGLFFLLPRTAEAAFSHLVTHRFHLPGFSNQVTLCEIGEIKTSSRTVMHIRIFSARPFVGLKWRGAALSEFDGRRWSNHPRARTSVPIKNGHVDLTPVPDMRPGRRISYHVELEPFENDALFFAGAPLNMDIRALSLYRTESDSYRLGYPTPPGFRYDAYSLLDVSPERAPLIYPVPVLSLGARAQYVQLPDMDRRIADLARTVTAGVPSDLERARAIERHLRTSYGYTLQLPDREVSSPLAYFLFTRKKGHCEYFASSMAVMLRAIGIPSRLATGFQSGVYNPISDLWLVRASDAHSWVEAWMPGLGWTTFDPTPPDPNPNTFALLAEVALYLDAAETFWREWVVTYDLSRQGMLAYGMEQGARRMGIRWYDALLVLRSGWNSYVVAPSRRFSSWVLAGLTAGMFIWLLGPSALRLLRLRRQVERVRRGQASMADATLLYERMLHILKRRGYQKPAWFTPAEFAASLPRTPLGTTVVEFTTTYNALRFGGHREVAPRLSVLLDELDRAGRR